MDSVFISLRHIFQEGVADQLFDILWSSAFTHHLAPEELDSDRKEKRNGFVFR